MYSFLFIRGAMIVFMSECSIFVYAPNAVSLSVY